jgi:hypothetical protein
LFQLETGVFIGSFGTHNWNIHDMEPYKNKKPRYVREWYLKLRQRMKTIIAKDGSRALDLKLSRDEIR